VLADWPYNLFAMVHGRTEEEVRRFVASLAAEPGLERHDVLFSTREYKKNAMRFFAESEASESRPASDEAR
jgi:siroheme decarboxylase